MTRVTIKELQSRLDEMRAQRDEARASANRLKGLEAEAQKVDGLESLIRMCHVLLDAVGASDSPNGPKGFVYRSNTSNPTLPSRLANFIVCASATAGKLEQADLMRREALGLDLFGKPVGKNP